MAQTSIPVDLRNPGQVFACLGLMEASEILLGPCQGRFAYMNSEIRTRFELTAPGASNPVEEVLQFLARSDVIATAPGGSNLSNVGSGVQTEESTDRCFPAPLPKSDATLPVRIRCEGVELAIEYWLDGTHVGRDNVKFWGGARGMPGGAFARNAVTCLSSLRSEDMADPFQFAAPMSSSFRFDWRRDYVPLDAGFSPNVHKPNVIMVGYPIVELLAAAGMQSSRPGRLNVLAYRYHVTHVPLPIILARALLGSGLPEFPTRAFRMRLGWPGQEGQARCIISVNEEFS